MKQTTLLSFFSKGPQKPVVKKHVDSVESITPTSSSPIRAKEIKEHRAEVETPASLKKAPQKDHVVPSSPLSTLNSGRKVKRVNYDEYSDDDDEEVVGSRRKRKRVLAEEDDGEEYQFHENPDEAALDAEAEAELADEPEISDVEIEVEEPEPEADDLEIKPVKQSKPTKPTKPVKQSNTASRFSAGSNAPVSTPRKVKPTTLTPQKKFAKENEQRYQWLVEVRDSDGHYETDPEYDPRTLYIPSSAWQKFTAFETQYWTIKCKMFDTVVFFKKGKFFELYEKDADIAHNKFDLKLAGTGRANMRLAGIPEMSFDYWAKRFVDEGYKVAKVDQKESSLAKEMREKGKKKESKVIKRELECVLTCGTLTDEGMLTDDMSKYCLAVKEETNADNSKTFGVCFVDTATGRIEITEFDDEPECGKLETLLAQVRPMEILVEKSHISPLVMRILRFNSHAGAQFNFLKSKDEFWNHEVALEELTRGKYFEADNLDDYSHYPATMKQYIENDKNVALSAFGALIWYLRSLKLDSACVSMGNFGEYNPFKSGSATMRLDGITLQNLEVFANSFDQSDKGTLFKLLNRSVTAFGKRAFRDWVVHPLMSKERLDNRFDSVELLMNDGELKSLIESKLSKLPDLERLLARVHSGSLKVKDFSKVIEGFDTILSLVNALQDRPLTGYLAKLVDSFPSLKEYVAQWTNAFDRHLAYTEGVLVPEPGVEPEFDASSAKVKGLEEDLAEVLHRYKREVGCKDICYKDSGKEIFLLEVPIRAARSVPDNWVQMGATSKFKRYYSPEVKALVRNLLEARELHKILCESLQQKLYARFDKDYEMWSAAVRAVGQIDCIVSLARSSESLGSPLCRPEFVENDRAFLEFKELRHPCFIPGGVSGTRDFIPNDVTLGLENRGQIGLLTGANAAGKSTLLRMTGIAVLMAQIGCFVPATSARLTPIDTIMTRLGANDNIMQGKSTFYVELSETKRMLESATPRSLIILDELGRGGSSSDGFAIAEAVLHHIATHLQSIGFFATHYGTLGQSFVGHPHIKPLRMGIIVNESSRNITFLYKLEPGRSSGSFGMHVASMCGVPKQVVDDAEAAAEHREHTAKLRKKHLEEEESIPLGLQSDFSWLAQSKNIGNVCAVYNEGVKRDVLETIFTLVEKL